MSFSSTVDYRYRLIAADLGGRPRTVMVTRVSYQGVENLQPMLHFEGIAKPLALDATQRLVVSQIARSTAVSDWVGLMMELHPVEQEHRSWIEVTPVGAKRKRASANTPPSNRRTATVEAKPNEPFRPGNEARTVPESRKTATHRDEATQAKPTAQEHSAPPTFSLFSAEDIPQTSIWVPILLGILLILAFVVVYQLETNDNAWQWLSSWL